MKITRRQLRQLIQESLQAFHYAIKPGGMKEKIKSDPNVHQKIKTFLDDPQSTAQAFEMTRAMDPTGEYGKELDQHDHAFLSSPEYERMHQADRNKMSVAYRSAPFKAMINKLLDDSGLRPGLENLKIDITMNERKNKPQGIIRSTDYDQLKRFKEFLDAEGGTIIMTYPHLLQQTPRTATPTSRTYQFHVLSV